MSAPTVLDSIAIAQGIASPTPISQARPKRRPGWGDRRASDPVSKLGRDHDLVCRQASDPYEIAAALEAAGINDQTARTGYQRAGVFDLAEHLWERVPWRAADDQPPDRRWELGFWRAQLRGLAYVVPAVVAMLVAGDVDGADMRGLVVVATIVSIGFGQALSVVAHALVGRGDLAAASALARRTLLAVTAVMSAVLVVMLAGDLDQFAVAAIASGQLVYVVAATSLVVFGADLLLAATVLPAAATSVLGLILGEPLLAGGGLVAIVVLPSLALRSLARPDGGVRLRESLGWSALSIGITAAVYGASTAVAASLAWIAAGDPPVDAGAAPAVVLMLPMMAMFGTAEYLLHRARRRCMTVSSRVVRVQTFKRAAAAELRGMLIRYVVGSVAIAGCVALSLSTGGADHMLSLYAIEYSLLGTTLLLTTTLLSMGDVAQASLLAVAVAVVVLAPVLWSSLSDVRIASAQLVGVSAVLGFGYRVAQQRFSSTAVHR
jgi:hypothetical protein